MLAGQCALSLNRKALPQSSTKDSLIFNLTRESAPFYQLLLILRELDKESALLPPI